MSIEDVIHDLEQRLLVPEVRGSAVELGRLLSDDFLEFGSSGRTFTKASVIEALASAPAPSAEVLEDFEVRELSSDAVLATYRCGACLRSSVWRREGVAWRCLFHQGTRAIETLARPLGEAEAATTRARTSSSLSGVAGPHVSLDALRGWYLGLIVPCPSGVIFENRICAIASATPSIEGIFAPIGTEDQYGTIERIFEGEAERSLSQRDADLIDEALSQDYATKVLTVDRERLGDSHRAWIFVKIAPHPERQEPAFAATRGSIGDPETPVNQARSPLSGFGATLGILTWPDVDAISYDDFVSRIPVVPKIEHVALRVAGPSHGWLSVDLELGDYRLDLNASMVLNDPLRELFDWITCDDLSEHALRRVCLWCEPEGYAVDVVATSPETLSLSVRFDKSFVPPMSGVAMMLRHRCTVSRSLFSRAVVRGLTEWLAGATDAELGERDRARYRSMLGAVHR